MKIKNYNTFGIGFLCAGIFAFCFNLWFFHDKVLVDKGALSDICIFLDGTATEEAVSRKFENVVTHVCEFIYFETQ